MPHLTYHTADGELLRRILSENDVARSPERPPVTAYLGAWMEAAVRWIAAFFEERPGLADSFLKGALLIAILTVALALVLVALSLIRSLRERGPAARPAARGGWTEVPDESAPLHDPRIWRTEIELRLARGDVAGALEAFWWWLACALPLDSSIDPSWTTRELLLKARRRELLGLGARLDVLMYGPVSPTPADVAACLARFEEGLT